MASYFPGRRITPIYFRRAIVTFIKGKSYGPDASGIDAFFKEKLAVLMNTSPDIIDLNYDRLHRADVNEETLRQVNEAVGLSPTEALADVIKELAAAYDAEAEDDREGALEIVSHKFASQHDPHFTVKFEDGSLRVKPWTEMTPLLSLVDVYWAKIGGPGEKVPEPKLPDKWGRKARKSKGGEKADGHEKVESPKKKLHVYEGEEDENFGLDPIPESSVSEEVPPAVDLIAMVDRTLPLRPGSERPVKGSALPAPRAVPAVPPVAPLSSSTGADPSESTPSTPVRRLSSPSRCPSSKLFRERTLLVLRLPPRPLLWPRERRLLSRETEALERKARCSDRHPSLPALLRGRGGHFAGSSLKYEKNQKNLILFCYSLRIKKIA